MKAHGEVRMNLTTNYITRKPCQKMIIDTHTRIAEKDTRGTSRSLGSLVGIYFSASLAPAREHKWSD